MKPSRFFRSAPLRQAFAAARQRVMWTAPAGRVSQRIEAVVVQ
jgi:hypothetical protein